MKIPALFRSLIVRIAAPVVLVSLVAGTGLYLSVQAVFSRFADHQRQEMLIEMAHEIYTICDSAFGSVARADRGLAESREMKIRQAFTLGEIETYLRQHELVGFVLEGDRVVGLNRELDGRFQDLLFQETGNGTVAQVTYNGTRYAVVRTTFAPWNWRVIAAQDISDVTALEKQVRMLALLVVVMVLAAGGTVFFALNASVRRPLDAIVAAIRTGRSPGPTGIAEYDDIAERLQEAIRKRNILTESMEKNHFLYAHDVQGNFTYLSPSITAILGYTPEEFRTHYTSYLTDHPQNRETIRRTTLSIQGQQQPPYEVEIFHKDGRRRWLEVSEVPVAGQDGTVVAVEGIAHDITARKQAEGEREGLISDLQKALSEIKTLQGIIPICASCKKIRDDAGAWQQLEAYLQKHSDAEFSHGICPECVEKLYRGIK